MPEPVADDLDVHARVQGEAGVRVVQVVQPDPGDAGLAHQVEEQVRHAVWPHQIPLLAREDQARVCPGAPPRCLFLGLLGPAPSKDANGQRVDGHDPHSGLGLRPGDDKAVACIRHLEGDRDLSTLEIYVGPVQPECFAAAHAGERDDVEQRVAALVDGRLQKAGQLSGLPDLGTRAVVFGEFQVQCRVPWDEAPLESGVQGGPQRSVDVLDRHGAGADIEPVEQVRVEGVDVVRPKIRQPHPTQ